MDGIWNCRNEFGRSLIGASPVGRNRSCRQSLQRAAKVIGSTWGNPRSRGAVADSDAPSRVAAVTLELCGVYSRRGVPLSCITQCTSLSKAHALTAFQCLEAASSAAEARRLAAKKEAENPDGGSKRPTSDSSSGGATRTSLAASGLKSEGSGGSKGKKHSTGGDSSQKSARVQSKKK